MPVAPPKPCTKPGCKEYAVKRGRCDVHQPEPWVKRNPSSGSYGGRKWQRIRDRIMKRDSYLCQPCLQQGRVTTAKEVDHILNKARGGTDSDDNLQAICMHCHREKTHQERREKVGGG